MKLVSLFALLSSIVLARSFWWDSNTPFPIANPISNLAHYLSPWNFKSQKSALSAYIDVPGFSAKEIHIHVKENTVYLNAKHSEKGDSYNHERTVEAQVPLPMNYDSSGKMNAKLKNGILKLEFPLKEEEAEEIEESVSIEAEQEEEEKVDIVDDSKSFAGNIAGNIAEKVGMKDEK